MVYYYPENDLPNHARYISANRDSKIFHQLDKPQITVSGDGADLSDSKALRGRAKKKMITQTMVLSLIKIAEKKGDIKLIPSFWNTYHCQTRIYSSGDRLYGKYCKNRFCTICSGIRKAQMINKYLPEINKWEKPYFLTLTVKACPAKRLRIISDGVLRAFRIIETRYKKKHQRGKSIKLRGIKSLECNFNPLRRTYNPHLHLIVENEDVADILVEEWLKLWTPKFTNRKAQYKRAIEDKTRDLMETIKYGSKIFTEPDVNKKSREKIPPNIYSAALYNILTTMKGYRIFERFGFNLPKTNVSKERKLTIVDLYEEWLFDPKQNDWVNSETDEFLSGYLPSSELITLLFNVNTEVE